MSCMPDIHECQLQHVQQSVILFTGAVVRLGVLAHVLLQFAWGHRGVDDLCRDMRQEGIESRKECDVSCPAGGMIIGDMPPYEAFPLGGTNSVRGYAEGAVGSARNFVSSTAEVRWPLFGPLEVRRIHNSPR